MGVPVYIGSSSAQSATTSAAGSLTNSYTGSPGTNSIVVMLVSMASAITSPSTTSATYNGVAMMRFCSAPGTGLQPCTYGFVLTGQGAAANAVFSWSGAGGVTYVQSVLFMISGANQTYGASGYIGINYSTATFNDSQSSAANISKGVSTATSPILSLGYASQWGSSGLNSGPGNPTDTVNSINYNSPGLLVGGVASDLYSLLAWEPTFNGPGSLNFTCTNGWTVGTVNTTIGILGIEPIPPSTAVFALGTVPNITDVTPALKFNPTALAYQSQILAPSSPPISIPAPLSVSPVVGYGNQDMFRVVTSPYPTMGLFGVATSNPFPLGAIKHGTVQPPTPLLSWTLPYTPLLPSNLPSDDLRHVARYQFGRRSR